MNEIAMHPEYEKLVSEIEDLKEELKKLIFNEDELKYHINKEIETQYMLKIGYLEYKVFKKEVDLLMIKKEIKLIQKAINLEIEINMESIKQLIDVEYEDSIKKLEDELSKINDIANKSQGEILSSDDSKLLKKSYKELILKLHPDLNENLSEEDKLLFIKVVESFEEGDLDSLIIFNELLTNDLEKEESDDSFEKLKEKISFLNKKIDLKSEEIDKIKSSYPYNKKELLENEKEVKILKNDLNQILKEYDMAYEKYKEKLEKLLKSD